MVFIAHLATCSAEKRCLPSAFDDAARDKGGCLLPVYDPLGVMGPIATHLLAACYRARRWPAISPRAWGFVSEHVRQTARLCLGTLTAGGCRGIMLGDTSRDDDQQHFTAAEI